MPVREKLAFQVESLEFDRIDTTEKVAELSPGEIGLSAEVHMGERIGPYKVLEKLGEGGCGVVYVAEQTEPVRRRVALKVIKLGMDSKAVVARFEAERQALAMMDHPNIARVLDAGTTRSGRPFFAMELVRGVRITEYCDQHQLNTRDRLGLFVNITQAIQHAHQKGIIHRDIKPSNILVTLHDGTPVPKVIDFGIAKATEGRLTDATVYTQLHQFIGTPVYMSPEQAEMSGLDIDTRSDIYSLGVLLYELLTGRTPFDSGELLAQSIEGMRKTIREKEPVRPSTRVAALNPDDLTTAAKRRSLEPSKFTHLLKGDLDWIVMKCLEKDRTRRYETANALRLDVERHLNNEPVLARPPSNLYRLQKAIRRNKAAFGAAAGIAAALILGVILSTWQALRATRAEREQKELREIAEQARLAEAEQRRNAEAAQRNEINLRRRAQMNAYAADMRAAQVALLNHNLGQAVDLLSRYFPKHGQDDLRGVEWYYLWQQSRGDATAVLRHPAMVAGARFSPNGQFIATACFDGLIRIWNRQTKTTVHEMDRRIRDDSFVGSFCFSPDGRFLASVTSKGIELFDARTWRRIRLLDGSAELTARSQGSTSLAFSRNGEFFAADGEAHVAVWNTTTWQPRLIKNNAWTRAIELSDDGKTIFAAGYGFAAAADPLVYTAQHRNGLVVFSGASGIALNNDYTLAALTGWSGRVQLHDLRRGESIWNELLHKAPSTSIAFSPDGKRIATGGFDQAVHLVETSSGNLLRTLRGHENEVWSVEFSRDNRWLVTSSKDSTARLWDTLASNETPCWTPPPGHLAIGYASGRGNLVTASNETVCFWNGGKLLRSIELAHHGFRCADQDESAIRRFLTVTPSGALLACIESAGASAVVGISPAGEKIFSIKFDALPFYPRLSDDGRWLAVGRFADNPFSLLELYDLRSPEAPVHLPEASIPGTAVRPAAFSHDGRFVAYGGADLHVKVWDLERKELRYSFPGHGWYLNSFTFSPDDRLLASSSWDGEVRIWEVSTGKLSSGPLRGHGSGVRAINFSPDARTLLSAGDDNTVRFWQVETGREMLILDNANTGYIDLLSPDGSILAIFDTKTRKQRLETITKNVSRF